VGNRDWVTVPFASGEETMHVQISLMPNRGGRGSRPSGFPITTSVTL